MPIPVPAPASPPHPPLPSWANAGPARTLRAKRTPDLHLSIWPPFAVLAHCRLLDPLAACVVSRSSMLRAAGCLDRLAVRARRGPRSLALTQHVGDTGTNRGLRSPSPRRRGPRQCATGAPRCGHGVLSPHGGRLHGNRTFPSAPTVTEESSKPHASFEAAPTCGRPTSSARQVGKQRRRSFLRCRRRCCRASLASWPGRFAS